MPEADPGVLQVTVEEIIESCADSCADDWAFWVYFCDADASSGPSREGARVTAPAQRPDADSCARAVYMKQRDIGIAWSPAAEEETAGQLPASLSSLAEGECLYHWIDLLYEGAVADRCLAVWIDGLHASLPVPLPQQCDDGDETTLAVSRSSYRLARLANEIDPDCSDFDRCFAGSGIELR